MRPCFARFKLQSWAFMVLLIWLTAACAPTIPTGKYHALAQSSKNLLKGTKETYNRIEKLQRKFSVVTVGDGPLDRNSFKPEIGGKSFDVRPELQFRTSALKVLVRYTEVLSSLAEKDYGREVDRASKQLSNSLKKIESSADTKNASGILATIANTVGKMIVEKKRREALNEVMDMAQPALDDLAALIESSNTKFKLLVSTMYNHILKRKNEIRPKPEDYNRFWFDTKIADEIAEVTDIESSLDSLNRGVSSIPRAHLEIRESSDQAPGPMEALKNLIEEGKQVNEFYRSVK